MPETKRYGKQKCPCCHGARELGVSRRNGCPWNTDTVYCHFCEDGSVTRQEALEWMRLDERERGTYRSGDVPAGLRNTRAAWVWDD